MKKFLILWAIALVVTSCNPTKKVREIGDGLTEVSQKKDGSVLYGVSCRDSIIIPPVCYDIREDTNFVWGEDAVTRKVTVIKRDDHSVYSFDEFEVRPSYHVGIASDNTATVFFEGTQQYLCKAIFEGTKHLTIYHNDKWLILTPFGEKIVELSDPISIILKDGGDVAIYVLKRKGYYFLFSPQGKIKRVMTHKDYKKLKTHDTELIEKVHDCEIRIHHKS